MDTISKNMQLQILKITASACAPVTSIPLRLVGGALGDGTERWKLGIEVEVMDQA
jgi:hypothetical protein